MAIQETPSIATTTFRKGSYITLENKVGDSFYVVKSGSVQLYRTLFNKSKLEKEILRQGDFFGIVGPFNKHPYVETCLALENSEVTSIKCNSFGEYVKGNTNFAIKVLKKFSNDLRIIDSELAKRFLKQKETGDVELNLFQLGEFYLQNENYGIAAYIFVQYAKNYPKGKRILEVKKYIVENKLLEKYSYPANHDNVLSFQDKEIIFSEFESEREVYVIRKGHVKITKVIEGKEVLLAVLKRGDFFGEMAILNDAPRAASAIAFGDTECFTISKKNFSKFIIQQENIQIVHKLISLLSERLWSVGKQLETLAFDDPYDRMNYTLFVNLLKNNTKIEEKKSYTFSFSLNDLITMIGISNKDEQEKLKSDLQERENKLFEETDGSIHCKNLSELKKEIEYKTKIQLRKKQFKEE